MAEQLEPGAAAEAERALAVDGEIGKLIDRVTETLDRSGIPYLFIGGLASAVLGRHRYTADIDVLVQPERAREVLEALGRSGFATEETFPHWLFKARDGDQVVDVLFRSMGDICLDEQMLERSVVGSFDGRQIRVVGPEDIIVMKALAHSEETPRHWFDALGILGGCPIDWPYLLERSRKGPARVLSLLMYAVSSGLPVAREAVHQLTNMVYPTPHE